jgi:hypothetical protein
MHTILASRYLTDHNYGRRDRKIIGTNGHHHGNGTGNGNGNGIASGQATPQTMTVNNMWRNSARTIGDILVLSDIINPFTYVALPFVNQAFYVAGSCYVKGESSSNPSPFYPYHILGPHMPSLSCTIHLKVNELIPEIEQHDVSSDIPPSERNAKQAELSRALLASVAKNNISTLQQGLAKQNIYWSGAGWISGALEQRIEGIRDVDLVGVTEKLASYVKVPDAGLVGGTPESGGGGAGGHAAVTYQDPGSNMGLFGMDGSLGLGTFSPFFLFTFLLSIPLRQIRHS